MYACEKCKANFNTEEATRRHEDNCKICPIVKPIELNLNLMYDAEGRVSNISFVWLLHASESKTGKAAGRGASVLRR